MLVLNMYKVHYMDFLLLVLDNTQILANISIRTVPEYIYQEKLI